MIDMILDVLNVVFVPAFNAVVGFFQDIITACGAEMLLIAMFVLVLVVGLVLIPLRGKRVL